MFVSIRRYRDAPKGFCREVEVGFLPILLRQPGFVAYYAVEGTDGAVTTVSVFSTAAMAEDSDTLAADWLKSRPGPEIAPAEIAAGRLTIAAPTVRG